MTAPDLKPLAWPSRHPADSARTAILRAMPGDLAGIPEEVRTRETIIGLFQCRGQAGPLWCSAVTMESSSKPQAWMYQALWARGDLLFL